MSSKKKKTKNTKETNREYKDRLFKFIFGNPENKAWTLSLYNAINSTSYENADDIQLTTIFLEKYNLLLSYYTLKKRLPHQNFQR